MLVMFGVGSAAWPRCSSSGADGRREEPALGRRLTPPLGVALILAAVYAVAA
jgi:hypothetical protein